MNTFVYSLFNTRPDLVRFEADKVDPRQFSGYFGFSPYYFTNSPYSIFFSPLARRTSGRRLETFTQTMLFRIPRKHCRENYFNVVLFSQGQTGEAWGPSNRSDALSAMGSIKK
jgi:hypothetical protein